jgi:cellulose synthase/poly-beta-1,6-N-acetylglucosamine synthase-like glycosyltransferase
MNANRVSASAAAISEVNQDETCIEPVDVNEHRVCPSVSVIIPVRNEEKHIEACIENVLDTRYPLKKIEILVIDGESTDRTVEIISDLQRRGLNVRLFSNPRRIPYSGLNIGLKNARGDIVMRVDARSICPQDYISKCVRTLLETGADNVGGVQRPIGTTPTQRAIALATSHVWGAGNAQYRLGRKSGYVDTVYLGCFRKEVFERVGLYDEDGPVISEDSEMNQRIRAAGGKVYLNKDIVVEYYAKPTLRGLWNQYLIYGGAKAHTFLRTTRLTSPRQLIPVAFLPGLIALALLSFVHAAFFFTLAAVVAIYGLSDLLASCSLLRKTGEYALFPHLLLVFPCIHVAWSLGFAWRLLEGSHPGRHWRK